MNKFKIWLITLLVMFSSNVFAEDKATGLLKQVFGGLVGGGADPLLGIIEVICNGSLMVGGILAGYTIIAGVIGTAHEGEMLGKKFSSIWVPIRTVIGTAGVVPMFNGYAFIQVVVMWLVLQGNNLANQAWESFVSTASIMETVSIKAPLLNSKKLVADVFSASLCVASYAKDYQENPSLFFNQQYGVLQESSSKEVRYLFGNKTGKKAICGYVSTTQAIDRSNDGTIDSSGMNAKKTEIQQAHLTALSTLVAKSQELAWKVVNGESFTADELDNLETEYNKTVLQSANSSNNIEPFKEVQASAKNDGWIMAGTMFIKLAKFQDAINSATIAIPESQNSLKEQVKEYFGGKHREVLNKVLEEMQKSDVGQIGLLQMANNTGKDEEGFIDSIKGFVKDPTIAIKKAIGKLDNYVINPNNHPVLELTRWGGWCFGIAGTLFLIMTILGSHSTALNPFYYALMGCGMLLSYYLPMLPFFLWIGAVIGWLVLVAEAVIASPLWFVNHLNPYGNDLTGSAGNGYRLVLSLTLRPILLIAGFAFTCVAITVVGLFINQIWASAFMSSQADSNIFKLLLGIVVAPMMYGIFMYTVITKLFGLTTQVADQILNWIGGQVQRLGGFSNELGGGAMAKSGVIGSVAGQALKGGAGIVSTIKDKLENDKANKDKFSNSNIGSLNGFNFGNNNSNNDFDNTQNNQDNDEEQEPINKYDIQKQQAGNIQQSSNNYADNSNEVMSNCCGVDLEKNKNLANTYNVATERLMNNGFNQDEAKQVLSSINNELLQSGKSSDFRVVKNSIVSAVKTIEQEKK